MTRTIRQITIAHNSKTLGGKKINQHSLNQSWYMFPCMGFYKGLVSHIRSKNLQTTKAGQRKAEC